MALHSLVDEGLIAIEEPETSMHPGYMTLYSKMLIDYIRSGRYRQVVLTTHSIEFIDYIPEFARESNVLSDVSAIQ